MNFRNDCNTARPGHSTGLGFSAMALGLLVAGTTIHASPIYSSVVMADNPVSYWRLGESTGGVAVDQMGNKNGSYLNSPLLGQAGAILGDTDTALGLGGNSLTRVQMTSFSSFPTSEISVEYWMKSSDQTEKGTVFSYAVPGTDNEFLIYDYQDLDIYINQAAIDVGVKLTDGIFNHVVVTWKSSNGSLKVYKNGALAFSGTHQAGIPMTSGGNLVLGQDQDFLGGGFENYQRFVGTLDEVAIYDHALGLDQVRAHYRAGAFNNPVPEGLPMGASAAAFAAVLAVGAGRRRS